MNFIRNRNFRAGPQTSLEGFICPQNSDKKQKIKVFGRSGGGNLVIVSVKDIKLNVKKALGGKKLSFSVSVVEKITRIIENIWRY